MITILKVKNEDDNNEQLYTIYEEFMDMYDLSIFDRMLITVSKCDRYEYLYLFLDQEKLNMFINLLLDNDITIYSKEDYTDKLISIIVNDKLDDFKNEFIDNYNFDELMEYFYETTITKDNILDKACFNGFESLNDYDYQILKK
jgi:hypothetical protein